MPTSPIETASQRHCQKIAWAASSVLVGLLLSSAEEKQRHSISISSNTSGTREAEREHNVARTAVAAEMYPYRFSNLLIGYFILATLLASVPADGGAGGRWSRLMAAPTIYLTNGKNNKKH
jgi:hypothetical protein